MKPVKVSGRFVERNGNPAAGIVRFMPSELWVEREGVAWAVPAPEVKLVDGKFEVELIRTDQSPITWFYTVECPVGKWNFMIESDGPVSLKNMLPKKKPA